MVSPEPKSLKRARELVLRMPNKAMLGRRLQKEGHDPEDVSAAIEQVFAERKAQKRIGALHERALSQLLAGEELDDECAAKDLKAVALKRRAKLLAVKRQLVQKRNAALLGLLASVTLPPIYGVLTGEWRSAIRLLSITAIITGSGLGYTLRMLSRYKRDLDHLDRFAARYEWWGPGGTELH